MTSAHPPASVPTVWSALLDDATACASPDAEVPGGPDVSVALAAYDARPELDQAVVGALAVPEHQLPGLGSGTQASVRVVVEGGAGAVAGIARLAARRALDVVALDITLRDLSDLAGNARRVVSAVDHALSSGDLSDECRVHVELPAEEPSYGWLAAADVVAEAELALRLRLGPDPVSPAEVVACLDAALDRETPFTTTGVDRAVRGSERGAHGFLNLVLATSALWDGAGTEEAARLLSATAADDLADRARAGADDLARARRWFISCLTTTPEAALADLRALGLLGGPAVPSPH